MSVLSSLAGPVVQGGIDFVTNRYFNKKNNSATQRANDQNYAMQKEFAQNGLRWKVADAKAAGINPLAALGTSTLSPSVAIQEEKYDNGLSSLGQNISRAMTSTMTKEEREIHELNKQLLRVKIDGQAINNNNSRNTGSDTYFPTAEYSGTPAEVSSHSINQKNVDVDKIRQTGVIAGSQSKYQYVVDQHGNMSRQPTESQAEIQESDFPTSIRENIKSASLAVRSLLSYGFTGKKLESELKKIRPQHPDKNYEYRWDRFKMHWTPVKLSNNRETQVYLQRNPKNTKRTFKVQRR